MFVITGVSRTAVPPGIIIEWWSWRGVNFLNGSVTTIIAIPDFWNNAWMLFAIIQVSCCAIRSSSVLTKKGGGWGSKTQRVEGGGEALERFRSLIYRRDSCEEIYGLTRTAVIRKTL